MLFCILPFMLVSSYSNLGWVPQAVQANGAIGHALRRLTYLVRMPTNTHR